MALLEYANRTVPQLMKKSVHSFFASDPLLKKLLDANQVKRSGGSSIKLVRIKSGHSDLTEISSTNISVPLVKKETFGSLTGDWGRYIKPMIIPHVDRDRAADPAEAKRLVQDTVAAVMTDAKNRVMKQIYIGNESGLKALGSLNGGRDDDNVAGGSLVGGFSTGTSTGLENGALVFDSPTLQAGTSATYLGQARVNGAGDGNDNWFNQFVAADIGSNYVEGMEEAKLLADSYSDDPNGITLAICSNTSLVQIGAEARSYPGGAGTSASAIVYTTDDIDKGRVHSHLSVIGGVAHYGNRFMTDALMDTGSGTAHSEHVYLLNPSGIEWWVNANNNFRTTEFYDGLKTSNVDADIAYCILECQFVVTNLMIQACTAKTS